MRGDLGSRRAALIAVVTVAGVATLCLLAVYAATVGPRDVLGARPVVERSESTPTQTTSAPAGESQEEQAERDDVPDDPPLWAGVLLAALYLVTLSMMAFVLFVALRWLLAKFRNREAPAEPEEEVALEALDAIRLRRELRDVAGEQRAALLAGEPRNAVVRCWLVFETTVERLGHGRRPWQTATELTLDVVATTGADREALSDLSELYRRARFSSEPVSETDRAAAIEALDRVHASLGEQAQR